MASSLLYACALRAEKVPKKDDWWKGSSKSDPWVKMEAGGSSCESRFPGTRKVSTQHSHLGGNPLTLPNPNSSPNPNPDPNLTYPDPDLLARHS